MRLVSVYKMEKLLPIISMLRLKNIKKSIKEKTIVNDISFDVPFGSDQWLTGP
jgi:ABC-type multidrug transport system ATPase subunit